MLALGHIVIIYYFLFFPFSFYCDLSHPLGEAGRGASLELLSEDEVELAAALLPEHSVKTVSPVDTHEADHR